jgi:hypothetical protein
VTLLTTTSVATLVLTVAAATTITIGGPETIQITIKSYLTKKQN